MTGYNKRHGVKNFETVLIANRGEIAYRIIKTVQSLGLKAVAIYSDADQEALHVKIADQACYIGASPANESYLRPDKIIDVARLSGADAVHPGYGFLSENADFARACKEAGLIFIGPPADAIDVMGDKAKAKRLMLQSGVACIPGYQDEAQSDVALLNAAKGLDFPIMVKAAAGGGGRGMRWVDTEEDLAKAIKDARSEALNAFGSDILILEQAIQKPRHVEIQIIADTHGQIFHLGERDCSVQRRHQKVIEESPCPVLTPELREKMGEAAIKAARAVNYEGAGTVEFILNNKGEFFFLEMNTRLQVEHPVTEMVTGLDLVALQVQIARGEKLTFDQSSIRLLGHAIEARLYAEDPAKSFLPMTGTVLHYSPANGVGIRVDSGLETGQDITPFYDPMIAKIIAHGETRDIARQRLVKALKDTRLYGVPTNQELLINILEQDDFISGEATTDFIAKHFTSEKLNASVLTSEIAAIGAALHHALSQRGARSKALPLSEELLGWFSANSIATPYEYSLGEWTTHVNITSVTANEFIAQIDDIVFTANIEIISDNEALVHLNDTKKLIGFLEQPNGRLIISDAGRTYDLVNNFALFSQDISEEGQGTVTAPMHGVILELCATEGQSVSKGDRLAILEAMKMQHPILANIGGVVKSVLTEPGLQVAADAPLFIVDGEIQ